MMSVMVEIVNPHDRHHCIFYVDLLVQFGPAAYLVVV